MGFRGRKVSGKIPTQVSQVISVGLYQFISSLVNNDSDGSTLY